MAAFSTITELRNMQASELEKDLQEKKGVVAKMRIDIDMRSQKDTAQYKKEKKQVARIQTVLSEKKADGKALKTDGKKATVRAPRAPKVAKASSSTSK